MAGSCVGPGLTGGPEGIQLYGPRTQAWPSVGPGCDIASANGLRLDPVTEKLWAPPDNMVSGVCVGGTGRVVVPTHTGNTLLTKLSLSFTAFPCRKTYWVALLNGGTAQFRLNSGNFWTVQQVSLVKINGAVPIYGFGAPYVNTLENNSGGVITVGAATPSVSERYLLNPGDVIHLDVTYNLSVLTYTPGSTFAPNQMTWSPPGMNFHAWSYAL